MDMVVLSETKMEDNMHLKKERVLHLPLKGVYFDAIRSGEKTEEYRLVTPFWAKRLEGREFDRIELSRGYPLRDDRERRLARPWRGFRKTVITHPHFGPDPVAVYAILVNVDTRNSVKKWLKLAGPGQFRGDGDWIEIDENDPDALKAWEIHRETGYLPTAEQNEKPES